MFLFVVTFAQQVYGQSSVTFEFKCDANLELYNGQRGVLSNNRGAVTVANLNDTDADGKIDNSNDDTDGSAASAQGRDEVDLMKLVIKKNVSLDPNQFWIKKTKGNIRLWTTETKKVEFKLDANNEAKLSKLAFGGNTATLYVEALSPSTGIKDIEIQLLQSDPSGPVICDSESATAFWFVGGVKQLNNSPMPTLGYSGTLSDCNDLGLAKKFNTTYISVSGNRWGHGPFNKWPISGDPANNVDKQFGGRILFEFTVMPSLDSNQLHINIDITRRKKARSYQMLPGGTSMVLNNANKHDFPIKNEQPNDDGQDTDEDYILKNDHVYSADLPSTTTKLAGTQADPILAFLARLMTFQEFVRITPYGAARPTGSDIKGSIASDVKESSCFLYLKTGPNSRYIADNSVSSYSHPVLTTGGGGNGTIVITLNGAVPTNGFELKIASSGGGKRGDLVDLRTNQIVATSIFSNGLCIIVSNGITVHLTEGTTPFAINSKWRFSTFTTAQPSKENVLTATNKNVEINP